MLTGDLCADGLSAAAERDLLGSWIARGTRSDGASSGLVEESFGFAQGERGRNARLEALVAAIDLVPVRAADRWHQRLRRRASRDWPACWRSSRRCCSAFSYDLSDVGLAEALDDRASFRRFCGFASTEAVPERTAFVRFRRQLVARGLDAQLFRAVVRQLEAQGLAVKTGTLVDATVIRQAAEDRRRGRMVRLRRRGPHAGEGLQGACGGGRGRRHRAPGRGDAGERARQPGARAGLAGPAGPGLGGQRLRQPGEPRPGAGEAGHPGGSRAGSRRGWRRRRRRRGRRGTGRAASVRCRVEKILGTSSKRSYGLGRARYLGLARWSACRCI